MGEVVEQGMVMGVTEEMEAVLLAEFQEAVEAEAAARVLCGGTVHLWLVPVLVLAGAAARSSQAGAISMDTRARHQLARVAPTGEMAGVMFWEAEAEAVV